MAKVGPTGIAPVIQVHPSLRCNLECAHCYSQSGPQAREELRLELLSDCLEGAVALGYRQLAVSGGEPLLFKPLPALLASARALGMVTTITSNGVLATHARWDELAPLLDFAAISIDGPPDEHDAIRCRIGAFARTLENFAVVRSSGVPFGLIFTLTQYNLSSLEFVVRLAAEQGAAGVHVHPLTLEGRAGVTLRASRPDGLELIAALCEARRLQRHYDIPVHVDALTSGQLRGHRQHLVPARPVCELVDVAPLLIVNADATVVPLTHALGPTLALGSLHAKKLPELAERWCRQGSADILAAACEAAWLDLTAADAPPAAYWYQEVAARTGGASTSEDTEAISIPLVLRSPADSSAAVDRQVGAEP